MSQSMGDTVQCVPELYLPCQRQTQLYSTVFVFYRDCCCRPRDFYNDDLDHNCGKHMQ